ncbi:hypothetical protein JCM10450v2_006799 [Rhodotorula kratochvilovae]
MDHDILINSSSSTATDKPPPLLWLPNELLDVVFRLAYEYAPSSKPICRRLYPIQQKHLYRRVRLDSYEALGSFCFAVRTVPVVRKHVVDLELRMEGAWNYASNDTHEYTPSIGDEDSDGEGGASQVVTPLQLSVLLARLPSLRVLDLQELDDALMKVVFLGKTTPRNLAPLEVLKITTGELYVVEEHGDEGEWLRQLARLPRLNTWDGPDLRAIAPHLLHLTLDELHHVPELAPVLRTAPATLRSLILRCEPDLSYTVQRISLLDDVLPRFFHLEHLALCEHTFTPIRLLSYLRSLSHLRTLSFDLGALATDELLLDILDGPLRLRHLRGLTLDHVECARGPTMESKRHELPVGGGDHFHVWPGWRSAVWGPGCSEAGVSEAVRIARRHGVVVDGSALETIGWEKEYGVEKYFALLAWGDRMCDYDEARAVLGDEVVDESLDALMYVRGLHDKWICDRSAP